MDDTKMVLEESFVRELCKTNYKLGVMRERLIFVAAFSLLYVGYQGYKNYFADEGRSKKSKARK